MFTFSESSVADKPESSVCEVSIMTMCGSFSGINIGESFVDALATSTTPRVRAITYAAISF